MIDEVQVTDSEGDRPGGEHSLRDLPPPPVGASGSDPVAADAIETAAQALFALGRTFSRQSVRELLIEPSGRAVDLSRVLVSQAVDDLMSADDGSDGVTVGAVAEQLGLDPSTASRLVADATRDGYLTRTASARDGRRVQLTLTASGRALVAASRRFQRHVFLEATAAWPEAERIQFARQFVRFAQAVTQQHAHRTGQTTDAPGAGDTDGQSR